MFKPADILIYSLILIMAAYPFLKKTEKTQPLIKAVIDNRSYFFESSKDSIYNFEHADIEVRDGKVRILNSDCPAQICVKKGWLQKEEEDRIICMPNKTIISFRGKKNSGIDAVTE